MEDGTVRLRLAAAPAEGQANREAEKLLSGLLRVPRVRVRVAVGTFGRNKLIDVEGLTTEEALARLREVARR